MKFYKGDIFYSLVRSNNTTSDGATIFVFSAWNNRGQQIDAGEIAANNIQQARNIILNY